MSIADSARNEIRNFTNIKRKVKKVNSSFVDGGQCDVLELESNMPLIVPYAEWLVERTSIQRYIGYLDLKNVQISCRTFMIEIVGSPFLRASVRRFN
jgi:hypothetical protein